MNIAYYISPYSTDELDWIYFFECLILVGFVPCGHEHTPFQVRTGDIFDYLYPYPLRIGKIDQYWRITTCLTYLSITAVKKKLPFVYIPPNRSSQKKTLSSPYRKSQYSNNLAPVKLKTNPMLYRLHLSHTQKQLIINFGIAHLARRTKVVYSSF